MIKIPNGIFLMVQMNRRSPIESIKNQRPVNNNKNLCDNVVALFYLSLLLSGHMGLCIIACTNREGGGGGCEKARLTIAKATRSKRAARKESERERVEPVQEGHYQVAKHTSGLALDIPRARAQKPFEIYWHASNHPLSTLCYSTDLFRAHFHSFGEFN